MLPKTKREESMPAWVRGAAFVVLLLLPGAPSQAQNWPNRAVTMVVPFAAGGGTDVLGRIVARRLSETLGQQVIVENVGGAGGMMGSARVAKSPPDGYQFVLGSRADAINQTLYKAPLYNLVNDLDPVALVADQPTVLVARKDLPVNGLQEFIAYAKANQGKMQYGSAGAGSTGFIDCALFNSAIGLNITHVPYRGGGPAMQDLMGGRIDYFCTLTGTAVSQIENGSIKAVAMMTRDRAPMLPNVPSTWEQGFRDFEASTWFGFYVPKGTPTGVIKRLHDATVEAIDTPSVQEQLLKSGSIVTSPDRRSTEYLRTFTESEIGKNGAPIKAAGLSIE
jgi:tripartite-type tricarboxylate transporter receptor subunit TctC